LLRVAAMNEKTLARTTPLPTKLMRILKVPKSTTAPITPTVANRRKRRLSLGLFIMVVKITLTPVYL
jgi:hypothetical protein